MQVDRVQRECGSSERPKVVKTYQEVEDFEDLPDSDSSSWAAPVTSVRAGQVRRALHKK